MNSELWKAVGDNALFVLQFGAIIVAMFVIAYIAERAIKRKSGDKERILATRKIAFVGVFSAIAAILHILRFSVPFIAPAFYEMDLGELPALIGAFAYGPLAGVLIVFIKVLLKLLFQGTQTAFVGDLANFVIGCSLVLPAAIIYARRKTKKTALIACAAATLIAAAFATVFNALYLIPTFARMFFGGSLDVILGMGSAINGAITSVWTLALIAVAPFNLLKCAVISTVTLLIYKKLSPILKK